MFLCCLRAYRRWAVVVHSALRRQGKGGAPVGGLLHLQISMASATLGAKGCATSQDSLRAGCSPKYVTCPYNTGFQGCSSEDVQHTTSHRWRWHSTMAVLSTLADPEPKLSSPPTSGLSGCFHTARSTAPRTQCRVVSNTHLLRRGSRGSPSPASWPQPLHSAGTGCRCSGPLAQRDAMAPGEWFPLCRSWYAGCPCLQKVLQVALLHCCPSFCTSQCLCDCQWFYRAINK